jgi:two-component system nitrogen regulation response regulator NtrX
MIPPLRKRISDLPVLIDHFLKVTAQELGQKPKKITKRAVGELMEYNWPGNVRELENLIERLVILTPKPAIDIEDLPALGPVRNLEDQFLEKETYNDFREAVEKEFFLRKLRSHGYNLSKTARRLGMQRSNLYKKLEKYEIPYKKTREDEEEE